MQVYTIIDSPVLVRRIASADSGIVNVLPVGSKLYVAGEESGWYRTTSGYYVFKTDNIVPDSNTRSLASTLKLANTSTMLRATSVEEAAIAKANARYASSSDKGGVPTNDERAVAQASARGYEADLPPVYTQEEIDEYARTILQTEDRKDGAFTMSTNVALTNQYSGHSASAKEVLVVDGEGNALLDKDGNYQYTSAPSNLQDKNANTIMYVHEDGQLMTVQNKQDGQIYVVKADGAKIEEKNTGNSSSKTDKEKEDSTKKTTESDQKFQQELNNTLDSIKALTSKVIDAADELRQINIKDTRTAFGMPYQFLPIVDPRISSGDNPPSDAMSLKYFGRKYQEKIVARAPILVMQPGRPVFLKGFSDDQKKSMAKKLLDITELDRGESEIDSVIGSNAQYYAFEATPSEYFYAVNSACRALAAYLGIADVIVPNLRSGSDEDASKPLTNYKILNLGYNGNQLGGMNWAMHPEHNFFGYYKGATYFYINSDAQISENFNTATRMSELAGTINGISDKAMEAMFLGGMADAATTGGAFKDLTEKTREKANANEKGGDSGLLGSILSNITTMLTGGKMMFPEIWADSQFGRSYNVTIKLDTPDCDKVSIYLNILVPLAHILGFVLPKAAGSNTYLSPFLVRCFYKSMFHIDMGMVVSCDITKGDVGAWTQDGLPTQVIVQLSIKDMYQVLSQSTGQGNNTMLTNPAQMEYLASLCGVSMAPGGFGRTLELWYALKGPKQRWRTSGQTFYTDLMQSAYATVQNVTNPIRWNM